ncbi:uncharacterized protein LOC118198096 isoform X1 [Stegodyphus dumicola]|uniref:uncharacterized protein LOC118198096 isoform X1 n=1 Tax=Stegodyphus dumicola TaxID=202533 RepID=UPI0015AA1B9C|nr:uncharacterized protein LOC118198096 isoform X1 [Stegodyphus dumicola]
MKYFLTIFILVVVIERGDMRIKHRRQSIMTTSSNDDITTENYEITHLNNGLYLLLQRIIKIQISKGIINPEVIKQAENVSDQITKLGGNVNDQNKKLLNDVILFQEVANDKYKHGATIPGTL